MTEFVDKDGFICYRLGRKKYITKHRFLYQTYHNCQLGPNEVVIFLDGNNRNFEIDNLYKVTRGELVLLNRWYKISSDPNETLDKIALIKLKQKRIEIAEQCGLTDSRGNIAKDVRETKRRYYSNHPEIKAYYREYQRKRRHDPQYVSEFNRKRKENRDKLR